LERLLERERAQLPPWFVIGFGSGIAAWFALGSPAEWQSFLCLSAALCVAGFALGSGGRAGRVVGWFALAAMVGCALVWARSVRVAEPRLDRPIVTEFKAPVEGVEHLAARDTVRLMLRPETDSLPPHVRISIDEDKFPKGIAPGSEISVRARLVPPPPMAFPAPTTLLAMHGSRASARSAKRWGRLPS